MALDLMNKGCIRGIHCKNPFPVLNQKHGGHYFENRNVVTQWPKNTNMEFHQQGRKSWPHDMKKVTTVMGLHAEVVG